MSSSTKTLPVAQRGVDVAKKRDPRNQPVGRPAIGKQVNVRLNDEILADLEYIAETLSADLSHVIRSILAEHSPLHYERARQIRANRDRARKTGDQD